MDFLTTPYFWLIVAILFIVIEMLEEPFGLLFFGIGGILAAAIAVLTRGFLVQFSVFVGGAFIGLFFFRRSYLALFRKTPEATNVSALLGQKGVVEEEIPLYGERGTVRIGGELWKARSADENKSIGVQERVTVVSVNGNTLLVDTIEKE